MRLCAVGFLVVATAAPRTPAQLPAGGDPAKPVAAAAAASADPGLRTLIADARKLVAAEDPIVRGEAALVLAASGEVAVYEDVLAVARSSEPEARLRGLLALGYLAIPGSERVLDDALADSATRPRPDGIVAAYALGLLPPEQAPASITGYFNRFLESSFKRQRDILLALLCGLPGHVAPTHRLALQRVLDDAANRDPELRAALLLALGEVPGALTADYAIHVLQRGTPAERRAVLDLLATLPIDAPRPLLDRVRSAVSADAALRPPALALLTRLRDPTALEQAIRAVRADRPAEVAQGTTTALLLGGMAMRRALERQFDLLDVRGREAMLTAFRGPMSSEFEARCLDVASDRRQSVSLRTAATLAVAQSGSTSAIPLLSDLFVEQTDARALLAIAGALQSLSSVPVELDRLHRDPDPAALTLKTASLQALLVAGHTGAVRLCAEQLRRPDLGVDAQRSILRAMRRALLPAPAERVRARLPEPVRSLLD